MAVAAGVVVVCAGLAVAWAEETSSPSTDTAALVAQSALTPHPPLGGPKDFGASGEPAPLGSLKPMHSAVDVTLRDSLGGFSLVRYYSATSSTWRPKTAAPGASWVQWMDAEPFGQSRGSLPDQPKDRALNWWHNLHSFVHLRLPECDPNDTECNDELTDYVVRDTSGVVKRFKHCVLSLPDRPTCFSYKSDEEQVRLERDFTGFTLHTPEGRYHYRDARGTDAWFLSSIEDVQQPGTCNEPYVEWCRRTRLTVSYGHPEACQGGNLDAGLPFVTEATTANGTKLRFQYVALLSRSASPSGMECVLDSVKVRSPTGQESTAVQYTYAEHAGTQVAGLLASAWWPESGERATYAYSHEGQPAWVVHKNGRLVSRKLLGLDDRQEVYLTRDEGPDRTYVVTAENNTRNPELQPICYPGRFGAPGLSNDNCKPTQSQYFDDWNAGSGGAVGGSTHLKREFVLRNVREHGPMLMTSKETCDPTQGSCLGMPAVVERQWTIGTKAAGTYGTAYVPKGAQDANGNWTAYVHELSNDVPYSLGLPPPELTAVHGGATDEVGSNALRSQYYSYEYGPAYTQQVKSTREKSLLASGSETPNERTTTYHYEPSTNRLRATINSGYTHEFVAGKWEQSWQWAFRSVGTFYLTHRTCGPGAGVPDTLGRTLEVHGPCLVTNENASDCSGQGSLPITQYEYYPLEAPGNNANRLKRKTVFTGGKSLSCEGTPGLTTEYLEYDARGHVTRSRDANGVETTFAYAGDRLVSRTTGDATHSQTTVYGYDTGEAGAQHSDYIRHPDGHYEVLCYRTGTPGLACAGGTVTDKLQWKAHSAYPDGRTWTEKVVYAYSHGALASESILDAAGQVRRKRRYEVDPLGRTTFEAWGHGTGSFAATARFDAEGNRKGQGLPYNTAPGASLPPDFCGGPGPYNRSQSLLCNEFVYDRLNRLLGMVEFPAGGDDAARMCVAYDAHGNVANVKTGCPDSPLIGDCSACTQPAVSFQHDDFGNLIWVTAPWMDDGVGGPGTSRYEYDAQGNLTRKQTPGMGAQHVEYTYDSLGRMRRALSRPADGGSELLYSFEYDGTYPQPPTGCPTPQQARTLGRVRLRSDSFGDTWFTYDALGNVTAAWRSRAQSGAAAGSTPCSESSTNDTPNSRYSYSRDGRLLSETYPHGRTVRYTYYPEGSGQPYRVQAVSVDTWEGSSVTPTTRTLIRNVRWEPFGGMRDYELVAPLAAAGSQLASVEYLPGAADTSSVVHCGAAARPSGDDGTGRLRGLWVSGVGMGTAEGGRTGDLFRRLYRWKADQLVEESTCLLQNREFGGAAGPGAPSTARYQAPDGSNGYDGRLQLRHATRPAGQAAAKGGSWGQRQYTYDRRGNRLTDLQDCWNFKSTYGTGSAVDRLHHRGWSSTACSSPGQLSCPAQGPRFGYSYTYDRDGRITGKSWHWSATDTSQVAHRLTFDASVDGEHAAVGAVYRAVSAQGSLPYEYFYDANGRRRLKRYPTGAEDEFFYDGDKLLEDRGVSTVETGTPDSHPIDEYVWLDGRPVAFIKSRFDANWQRQPDLQGDCTRNGEAAPCGVYFVVTDYLKKPVLVLDSYRRVAGTADYEPFGHVNRVTYLGDTGASYGPNSNKVLGYFNQPPTNGTTVRLRAQFHLVDTESTAFDYAYLSTDADARLGELIGGEDLGPTWSGWVQVPQNGRVHARFRSDGINCSPSGPAGCSASGFYDGAVLQGYEYQRFQSGASPVWTPLRFPGQYHDVETDLFENWNRFYDPSLGRYLGPEPMYSTASWVVSHMAAGNAQPTYAYALNGPVARVDPDGNEALAAHGLGACLVTAPCAGALALYSPFVFVAAAAGLVMNTNAPGYADDGPGWARRYNPHAHLNEKKDDEPAKPKVEPGETTPVAGGGANVDSVPEGARDSIQSFSDRRGVRVTLVGSRAKGTAGPDSDWDYVVEGNSRDRQKARSELPRGRAGGEIGPRGETGIDVFNGNKEAVDTSRPYIQFRPKNPKNR
ncbi:RHS repeat-associated core domain-containing protein [Pyxidicoccus xibeiensis]|uniref:RHS repeat-associated core domain-containing protein n=1 Tax=Pyxidicoccus xibeiensis TaxID=2906759 RepID=UPI0020A7D17D|nr:RHS repeat-associated core domain-containing protein [Pyxidicoccus xibeiensis]MCP3143023.1 nucleotidyltransferase domain-containing protein [Pyxidicoccus xibeiensis]